MNIRTLAFALVAASSPAIAQKAPVVRQIGKLERMSTDSLASVATALPMADGRVLVNDRIARRVLLFDSTLAHATVVADTTAATANAYGGRPGVLLRYRSDTAIFIDQSSLSMFVIGPTGAIVRVMAVPRPEDVQAMGLRSGFDVRGRLVYFNALGSLPGMVMLGRGDLILKEGVDRFSQNTDSAFLVRVDPATRVLDSVTSLRIPKGKRVMKLDAQRQLVAIETTPDPLPLIDDWAMLPDGSIAVVRARDYHIDWMDANGHWSSTPKLPFDWQRIDDQRKQTLIDSAVKAWQGNFDRVAQSAPGGGGGGTGGRGGGDVARGGSSVPGVRGSSSELAPNVAMRASLGDLPDYMPPIAQGPGGVVADAEGNVWIRTTTMVQGQPVYDIVNRRGELLDRVQLPPFRTIAGFGPGVVYMAVKDTVAAVHLERARIK